MPAPLLRVSEPRHAACPPSSTGGPLHQQDETSTPPSKHAVFTVNTADGRLPLLFVNIDGRGQLLKEQALYARLQKQHGKSHRKIANTAKAIGRFWDWVIFAEQDTEINGTTLPQMLARFIEARYVGTFSAPSYDKFGLNWRPVKRKTVDNDLREITEFSDFISSQLGYEPLNPQIASSSRQGSPKSNHMPSPHDSPDLLAHLARSRRQKAMHQIATKSRVNGSRRVPGNFPLDRIKDLIKAEKSISKKMIYIELAAGGLRISEPLHHFVTDILPGRARPSLFPNDAPSNLPLVILADPTGSNYIDTTNISSTDRRQYLSNRYGLIPRNELQIKGGLHSGWKGMLYDNENLKISQIYWSSPELARFFYELYQQLLHIRLSVPKVIRDSHPYLYITENRTKKEFGRPLTLKNVEKSFSRACAKIGLLPYKNKISPHGLRHGYKKQLQELGLAPSVIQVCMHHRSIESQAA